MSGEKKKKSFRKEYLNDFQKNDSGKYVYSGEHRTYEGGAERWRKVMIILWICLAVPAALLIVIGCISGSGLTGNILIILPYALELIALFIVIWKMVRLTYGGMKLRKYVYESTVLHIPVYASVAAAIAAIAFAGIIVSLIIGTFSGSIAGIVLYILTQAALAAGSLVIIRLVKSMKWS
ncbi:MAG: hypothetical protein E7233_06400 [Lachnospiraceae bacterium]|nr:hypothetical protein [Lachnospiraceae bacterium]